MLQTQERPFSRAGSGCTHIKVDQRQQRLHISMGPGHSARDPEERAGRKCRQQHWGGIYFCLDVVFPCSERRQQLDRALLLCTLTQCWCKSVRITGNDARNSWTSVPAAHGFLHLFGEEARH